MRICHVITRLIIGGAQENTILTCEGLRSRGHDVLLLAGPETGPEGSLWERARAGGYEARVVDSLRRAVRPARDFRALGDLRRAFRDWRPDVVHTHSSKAGILGRLAAEQANAPTIVHTIHGMSFNRTQPATTRALYHRLERWCGGKTHGIIGVADAMIAQAREAGIVRDAATATIYSGMEVEQFDPDAIDRDATRRAWGAGPGDFVIGTVARLFANKGYEQLLASMRDIVAAVPNARFVWIGDGASRAEYLAAVEQLGLSDRLHLTGLVPPSDVPQLVAGMDVLVHLSQWEGLPRAVVQALLMRVPAVTWNTDGAPEVVRTDETGVVVSLNDTRQLVAAIARLAGDPALRQRMGAQGRAAVLERFDYRVMVERIEAFYARLRAAVPETP